MVPTRLTQRSSAERHNNVIVSPSIYLFPPLLHCSYQRLCIHSTPYDTLDWWLQVTLANAIDYHVTYTPLFFISSLLIFVFFFKKLSLFFSPLLLVFPLPLMLFLYPHNLAFPYLIHPWLCKTPSYLTSGVPTTKNYTFPLFCLNVHENTSIHSYIYTNKHTLLHV